MTARNAQYADEHGHGYAVLAPGSLFSWRGDVRIVVKISDVAGTYLPPRFQLYVSEFGCELERREHDAHATDRVLHDSLATDEA